jgi:hypothetical protein
MGREVDLGMCSEREKTGRKQVDSDSARMAKLLRDKYNCEREEVRCHRLGLSPLTKPAHIAVSAACVPYEEHFSDKSVEIQVIGLLGELLVADDSSTAQIISW